MSRKRKDDMELWERVKKTTTPLNPQAKLRHFSMDDVDLGEVVTSRTKQQPFRPAPRVIRPYNPEPAITISLAPEPVLLDEKTTRKIAKGQLDIDGRIDLHGMTQSEAHFRLHQYLENARFSGKRTVLVITGKGVQGEGILRQAVPRWFSEPEFRKLTTGYHESHSAHGGSGALYVRLRRIQTSRL